MDEGERYKNKYKGVGFYIEWNDLRKKFGNNKGNSMSKWINEFLINESPMKLKFCFK